MERGGERRERGRARVVSTKPTLAAGMIGPASFFAKAPLCISTITHGASFKRRTMPWSSTGETAPIATQSTVCGRSSFIP